MLDKIEFIMEVPKLAENQNNQIVEKQDNKKINKEQSLTPSDHIVEEFVKINGDKSSKIYQKLSFLGKGGFAECYLTMQKDTNRRSATKIIPKKLLDSHRTKLRLANEIKLHKALHNQYVVQLYNYFEDDQNVYINLQVCQYGSINDILRGRYMFTLPEAQSFIYGICHGLKYLHSRNIIHRDLKLGNIFLDSNFQVKIGDFGLACKLQFVKQYKRTVCGTPNYIAPQVLEGKGYHFQIDIWAVGVILYTLFFTIPPFETQEPHTTYQKIRKGQYDFPKYYEAPTEAIDLIKQILVPNPSSRPTLDQILNSPFMKLGNSIPLGLPPVSAKRPPTKKQLAAWPSLQIKQSKQQKSEMNSTVLDFFKLNKKKQSTFISDEKIETTMIKKRQAFKQLEDNSNTKSIICKIIEIVQNQLIFFFLSNGNFGIYCSQKQQVYTCHLMKDSIQNKQKMEKDKGLETVNFRWINDFGISQQQTIKVNDCSYRILLNIKHKQLIQKKMQIGVAESNCKEVSVAKINIYKDVFLVKFTNKAIQIVFKQKDGFFLSQNRKNIEYYYNFQTTQKGKQIVFSKIAEIGCAQKENRNTTISMNSIFKQGKSEKHQLTVKKLMYLKGVLGQTINRVPRKSYS